MLILIIFNFSNKRDEVCQSNSIMCPICDNCSFNKLSDQCTTYRINSIFDNPGTIFFSVFMSIWGNLRKLFYFS
jgi:hypothetical protein